MVKLLIMIRIVVPLILFFASCWLGFATAAGKVLITAGSAILLHLVVEFGLALYLQKNQETTPLSKTKTEAIKFTINAVTVVTGVLLGLISNQSDCCSPNDCCSPAVPIITIAFVSYGFGMLFGLINITLFTSGIEREYTCARKDGPNQPEMTLYEVEMKPVMYYTVSLLLNLQFMCLFVGIAATAFLHL